MRLKDKVCLITGAGKGIGAATAAKFAEEGAVVEVADIDEKAGQGTVVAIQNAGGHARFTLVDVTNESSIANWIHQVTRVHKRIDVLFNNAGISAVGELHEVSRDVWDRVLAVNVTGVYLVSKTVVPVMMGQHSGSIINMSSCIAEIGLAQRAAYAATKGAVLAMTKSMQVDYAPHGIRVNALLPGTIYTPFVEDYLKRSYEDPTAAIEQLKLRQLGGDLGTPEDVAFAALYLASEESRYVLGTGLSVDGGVVGGKSV
ncbi:SDR family NAD(P)-dependent oxidoreductase [Alicyclobacillus sp. SO9]|uniref:SDR family NAD(P)-dependent oxidoreductase n=1 Tax=Alicyclobacillus sp. SO9 TaxID=2665646 RepID=UPI0018E6FF5D|nr:SDR family NAD(P)-dependent oxidoreductase [Alicyclobacillus sp. SO9]QQE77949.1 SDR family oxidoreductase [Alicyclobacillus sp. SO9]